MIITVLSIVGPVILVVLAGYFYASRHKAQMGFIDRANMDVFVPALIFSALTGNEWTLTLLGPLLIIAAAVILLPGLLSLPLSRLLNLETRVVIPPIMFNNSGNLGIPLMVFAFGESVLPLAVLLFIVENTLHFTLGVAIVTQSKSWLTLARSPIILATVLAIIFHEFALEVPLVLNRSIELLGEVAIPLMLFGLGTRIRQTDLSSMKLPFISAICIPAVGLAAAYVAFWLVDTVFSDLAVSQLQQNMIWLYAVLPPAVLNYLVAERFLDCPVQKKQVAALVLWGNITCVFPISIVLGLTL